jgi:hypothetical protein
VKPRLIDTLLVIAIVADLGLAIAAVASPSTWFSTMHHGVAVDSLHHALLDRASGAWAMLAIVQIAALIGWKRWSPWLLIVAGARLSDVLPDVFYLAGSPARTLSTWGLIGAPIINLAFAWVLVSAWRANSPSRDTAPARRAYG